MKRLFVSLAVALAVSLALGGCTQAAPPPVAPGPAAAPSPALAPTAAAAPTAAIVPSPAAAPKEPTKAAAAQPAAPQPATAKPERYPAPGRPISVIIPQAAGGGTDLAARVVFEYVGRDLGTTFQILNKPGAATQIGMTEIAQAKPDGYTIGVSNLPGNLLVYLDPARKAVYTRKDFQPIANTVWDGQVLAVKADSRFKTLKDLIDEAKRKPQAIKIAAPGLGGNAWIMVDVLAEAAGVEFTMVNIDDTPKLAASIIAGDIDGGSGSAGGWMAMVKGGQLRYLATSGSERSPFFPDVPTMESFGYKNPMITLQGVIAPAGVPKDTVDVLSGAIKKALENGELKAKLEQMAIPLRYLDTAQMAAVWQEFEPVIEKQLKKQKTP